MIKVGQVIRDRMSKSIQDGVKKTGNTFVISYKGVSASRMNGLRKDLKKKKADMQVSRNTIARVALKILAFNDLADKVSNRQTAFVWSNSDAVEISKVLVEFSKKCEGFVVQGGLLNGAILDSGDVKRLSELPAKEVLIAKLLGLLQSPMSRLAYILNGKTQELLSVLKQLSEKKGGN